ncbi:MAG TPA: HNH endonuclease signature motif containing protein, partial [Streptosporangiaceae bacterium]
LEDACNRLIASGFLPQRAGQPTQVQLIMSLDQLAGLARSGPAAASNAGSAFGARTMEPDSGARSGSRASSASGSGVGSASGSGAGAGATVRSGLVAGAGMGCAAVPGPLATPGDLCDASIVPVVAGHVDHELLDRLAGDLLGRDVIPGPEEADKNGQPRPVTGRSGRLGPDFARDLILRNAVALLSGPGGLASRLRTSTLAGPAATISLPLDVGASGDTIPPQLRRAVILRDQHCGFPGCYVSAHACQVHHFVPVSEGGPTSLENLGLGCRFHHLVAIHQWGWKLVLNADGTKTAISPDGARVLRSHDPPGKAA